MKNYLYGTALVAVLALTTHITPAFAQDDEVVAPKHSREIPMIDTSRTHHEEEDVKFVTGGIGEDERTEIEAARGEYNVHVTSARLDGAFVEDTRVIIRNKAGEEVLDVDAGPLLYVQLAPGSYTVEATHNDIIKKRNLTIGKKTKDARVHFGWKPAVAQQ
jgi:hypothetical protein